MSKSSEKSLDWGVTPRLTPEQIIVWLDGHRAWTFEVWRQNPELRKRWERINEREKLPLKRDLPS